MVSGRGFTNQQAILVLLICFPLGLIALGIVVMILQRPAPQMAQQQPQTPLPQAPRPRQQPSDRSTTIQPLPSQKQHTAKQTGLTQLQAREIVERWLTVKSQIFAPPFNKQLADQVVANGPLWTDLTKTNGSIQWLKNNNSYYTYKTIKVNGVVQFQPSPSMPSILVSVTEDSTLHSPKGNAPSSSTNNWLYTLKKENGRWKIWDYSKK